MEAIVLAAGKGTRMRGLCDQWPKPMLPLANRPILDGLIGALAEAGVDRVFLVVGFLQEIIREYYRRNPPPIPVEFIVQETINGTGGAALLGRGKMKEEPFLLCFGDCICSLSNYPAIAQRFAKGDCDGVLSIYRDPDPVQGASVQVKDGCVTGIIEKPPTGTAPSPYNNAGIFIFPPAIFELLAHVTPSPRGELELTDAINRLVADGGRMAALELAGYWFNLSDPETLLLANHARLAEAKREQIISPTARVGHIQLGPNVAIGDNCIVYDKGEFSHCILLDGAIIGEQVVLRHAVVGRNTRIAPGTQLIGTAQRATGMVAKT